VASQLGRGNLTYFLGIRGGGVCGLIEIRKKTGKIKNSPTLSMGSRKETMPGDSDEVCLGGLEPYWGGKFETKKELKEEGGLGGSKSQ